MKKIIYFSYHYPPDLSAGAIRSESIVKELLKQEKNLKIWVFCSLPKRYNNLKFQTYIKSKHKNLKIIRFWIPFLGQNPLPSVIAYLFYFLQAIPLAILIRPQIIIGTSAKLLTSFVAACSAQLTRAKLYIDFRDTFSDNFFYFYRWHKRIILQSFILTVENIVLRRSNSINMVSVGFKYAFSGWDTILEKYSISITNFTNGLNEDFRKKIKQQTFLKSKRKSQIYKIIYAGNLGEGQDILSLIKNINENKKLLKKFNEYKISFDIYGSGSQLKEINKLLSQDCFFDKIKYCGLVPRNNIHKIYGEADCLMLHLANYLSLSLVIPSKIFEYTATPFPIIYSANGFTRNFIEKIEGTIYFNQGCFKSFLTSINISKELNINYKERSKFLEKYSQEKIIKKYVKHILN